MITVKRIEYGGFHSCTALEFVKLSRNLACIGDYTFTDCVCLKSIFIPPSCRYIGRVAFWNCMQLLILQVSQHFHPAELLVTKSRLVDRSPFELEFYSEDHLHVRNIYYKEDSSFLHTFWRKKASHFEVNQWIQGINEHERYALHRECVSYEPSLEKIVEVVKDQASYL